MSSGFLSRTEIEGRGRGLVASQPLKAGQIVLRDSPIILYSTLPLINQSSLATTCNKYCANCFRTLSSSSTSVVPCPCCSHHHVFCTQNCLSAALASSHSPWVCQAISRLRDCPSLLLEQPVEHQVQARFLVASYHLALVSPSQFQILLSLEGTPDATDTTTAQFLHSLISSLCPPPSPLLVPFSVELTAALLSKDKLNAFGLMEPLSSHDYGQRSVRAYGIYPNASFFNHDCLPNACRFDYVDTAPDRNTDIIVRMIHDVPQGREICLSYFPVNENYASRQRRLMEDYGFTCHCDRCNVEANWSDHENDDDDLVQEEEEEEDDEGDELMDEDNHDQMVPCQGQGDTDFPHAYFFLRYMCDREDCWGTLAPLPPKDNGIPSNVMECNVCGNLKNDQVTNANGAEDELSMDD
ncbi:histone-lysine N-methyltransferase ASHR2-like [Fagus crenata]